MTEPLLLLTTGGTIDKLYFDALSEYQIGGTIMGKLLAQGGVKHPHRIEELLRKDSLDLDDADRALIVSKVVEATERCVVITHGTDTMTVTAAALEGVEGKTIVLVGAMAPARFIESDAAFNLGMAFAAAQVAAPGVYIAMSGTVFRAGEVVKDRAAGAFVSKG
jgi:L-asparaginase